MSGISIRNLEPGIKAKLRMRAASNGRSMEAEARSILRATLVEQTSDKADLGEQIRKRFAAIGGVDLHVPPREPVREPPIFDAGKG